MDATDLIDLNCPACGRLARYPAVHAGSSVTCPSCKHVQLLPARVVQPALAVAAPVAPAAPAAPAAAATGDAPAAPPAAGSDKVLFVCSACTYRARIPAQYVGMAVRCPSCDAAQIASPDEGGASTGRTVQISRMASSATTKGKSSKTTVRAGNILFTCGQCSFEAQLAKHYLGKAIRCPGCHAPQVVLDSSGAGAPAEPQEATPPTDPRFICISCGYRARIPDQYMGLAVTCPKCETVQIASREDNEAPATGDTVSISRIKTSEPVERTQRGPGEEQMPFTCSSCGFKTHLGKSLTGMAIKCPGCQATQVVGGVGGPGAAISGGGLAPPPATGPGTAFAAAMTAAGDKVRFTCTACGFKARIPSTYAGETIHCPGCNVVQMVLRSGPSSTVASGNTQILTVVQTAAPTAPTPPPTATAAPAVPAPPAVPAAPTAAPAAVSPIRSKQVPTHTPEFGSPVIADPAQAHGNAAATVASPAPAAPARGIPIAPAPAPAPATAAVARAAPATKSIPAPAPAAPAASRSGTAPGDELSFDHTPPAPAPQTSRSGKVVRRNGQTPPPAAAPSSDAADGPPAVPAKPSAPAKTAAVAKSGSGPAKSASKPSSDVQTSPVPNAAAAAGSERNNDMDQRAPRTSPVLVILLVLILVVVLGGGLFLGKMLMDITKELANTQAELKSTNDKLSKAEGDRKKAQDEADAAKKAQDEESKARKAADEKTAELQKQLADETAKAEAAKAAAAKAEAEKAAADKAAADKAAQPAPKAPEVK